MGQARHRNRRSFLAMTIGGSIAGAAALVLGSAPLEAQARRRRMLVDADPSDPARTGLSDHDAGTMSDPAGDGRGGPQARRRGLDDADQGATADPRGRGRGPTRRRGRTGPSPRPNPADADPTDPVGHGRAPRERFVVCPGHRRCRR